MGWPPKNDAARLYQEKKAKSFMLVITENGIHSGCYEAVANVHDGPIPTVASTGVSQGYLLNCCKRVQWSDLPVEWQRAFSQVMQDWDQTPQKIRGFWKIAG